MSRIDSHIHLWRQRDWPAIPIASGIYALQRAFLPEDLAVAAQGTGMERFVLVEAAPNTEETDFILEYSRDLDPIVAVVGWVDLEAPTAKVISEINRFQAFPKFRGVRSFSPGGFDGRWLGGERVTANYRALIQAGITVELLISDVQVRRAHALIASIEGFAPLINHGARPVIMSDSLAPWDKDIAALAHETPALCKISALAERAGVEWNVDRLYPFVAHLIDVFGPDRLMFGSNWPVMTIMSTYARWVEAMETIMARLGLTQPEIDAIWHGTAERFYRIGAEHGQA